MSLGGAGPFGMLVANGLGLLVVQDAENLFYSWCRLAIVMPRKSRHSFCHLRRSEGVS